MDERNIGGVIFDDIEETAPRRLIEPASTASNRPTRA